MTRSLLLFTSQPRVVLGLSVVMSGVG
jgi:hypothetical protein